MTVRLAPHRKPIKGCLGIQDSAAGYGLCFQTFHVHLPLFSALAWKVTSIPTTSPSSCLTFRSNTNSSSRFSTGPYTLRKSRDPPHIAQMTYWERYTVTLGPGYRPAFDRPSPQGPFTNEAEVCRPRVRYGTQLSSMTEVSIVPSVKRPSRPRAGTLCAIPMSLPAAQQKFSI